MPPTPARKALDYAENELGVHQVFEDAQHLAANLDKLLGDLDKAHDTKRALQSAIEDRGYELLSVERGKHHDMSATALDQHMKQVRYRDDAMKQYRSQLDAVTGEIQGLEYDAEMLRLQTKILTARMQELGGYLHYLAAVKEADTLSKATTTTEDKP